VVVATAAYSGDTGRGKISMFLLGAIGALITWIAVNHIGKRILELETEHRRAIQVAEANAFIRTDIATAMLAVAEAGTALRATARTSPKACQPSIGQRLDHRAPSRDRSRRARLHRLRR